MFLCVMFLHLTFHSPELFGQAHWWTTRWGLEFQRSKKWESSNASCEVFSAADAEVCAFVNLFSWIEFNTAHVEAFESIMENRDGWGDIDQKRSEKGFQSVFQCSRVLRKDCSFDPFFWLGRLGFYTPRTMEQLSRVTRDHVLRVPALEGLG